MFAVIKTGGKQYRVQQGDKLRVESLDVDQGEQVTLDQVLMVGEGENVTIGNPLVGDATVTATVVSHGRGKKIEIVKFRRRKHYRRQMGHRQNYTELEINNITGAPAGASSASGSQTKPAAAANTSAKATAADSTATSGTGELRFMDAPNGQPDDLKKILGVGPVLEEKLNGMGVFHYSQVAGFSPSDIESINTHLNFPGRIERDEWIPQAKDLMGGGEGRRLKYLEEPEGEKDDLKLISGVGPVLEDKLNELGIFHFWQIAKFEQKDIDLVNDAMSFPGRIERDEWIAQADSLANGGAPR